MGSSSGTRSTYSPKKLKCAQKCIELLIIHSLIITCELKNLHSETLRSKLTRIPGLSGPADPGTDEKEELVFVLTQTLRQFVPTLCHFDIDSGSC